jgi:hypothetical protein
MKIILLNYVILVLLEQKINFNKVQCNSVELQHIWPNNSSKKNFMIKKLIFLQLVPYSMKFIQVKYLIIN